MSQTAEFVVSIRILLPEEICNVLMAEKKRFIEEYGSGYMSEPHITLYLSRYTEEGFSELCEELKKLRFEPFHISLLEPKTIHNEKLPFDFYRLEVSDREKLHDLHQQILNIAASYKSPAPREKDQKRIGEGLITGDRLNNLRLYGYADADKLFDPHITLGQVPLNLPQPSLADISSRIRSAIGKDIYVSKIAAFLHKREQGEERASMIKKTVIDFVSSNKNSQV